MMVRCGSIAMLLCVMSLNTSAAQNDFFWSHVPLNFGASNSDLYHWIGVGDSVSLFIYYSEENSDLDTHASLEINLESFGDIRVVGGGVFNPVVSVGGVPVGCRWGGDCQVEFFEGEILDDGNGIRLSASRDVGGFGMIDATTNSAFRDEGYDQSAEAFLFARVDFQASCSGIAHLMTMAGPLGNVNDGMSISPIYGAASLRAELLKFKGDFNLDEVVNLLDVPGFVQALITGSAPYVADMNCDDEVNLLDVPAFIDRIEN